MKKIIVLGLSCISFAAFAQSNGYPQQQQYTGKVEVQNPNFEKDANGAQSNCDVSLKGSHTKSKDANGCHHQKESKMKAKTDQKIPSKDDYEVDP